MSAAPRAEPGWMLLRVQARRQSALNTVTLRLVAEGRENLPSFEAGAYIDVITPAGHLRPYSLCNAPHQRDHYEIVVRCEEQGRGGSLSLCRDVRVGDGLQVRPPVNEFSLCQSAVHSVFLGAGIGLAPLMSMAETLWRRGAPFEVHAIARTPKHSPFDEALQRSAYRCRIRAHWTEFEGRPDLRALLRGTPVASDVYACGPKPFLLNVSEALATLAQSRRRLHVESFDPASPARAHA